jgi:hypothetical protein
LHYSQALHLVSTQRVLARKLHALSRFGDKYDPGVARADRQGGDRSRGLGGGDLTWPFMCVSINFTKDSLQTLRSGALNKKCNKRKDVLSVLFVLHHALFYDFGR